MRIIIIFLTLTLTVPKLSASCDAADCGGLAAEDLLGVFSNWPEPALDCNGDNSADVLDMVCTLNQMPSLVAPVLEIPEIQTVAVGAALSFTIQANDANGDQLTFSARNLPAGATLAARGQFYFAPQPSQSGVTYNIEIVVSDGFLQTSGVLQVQVLTLFTAMDQDLTVDEDQALYVTLAFDDPPSEPLTYEIVNAPASGTLTGVPPNLIYRGNANFYGADHFTFRAFGARSTSTIGEIVILIDSVNDVPVADELLFTGQAGNEWPILLSGSDADGDIPSFQVLSQPLHGTLSGTPPQLTYHAPEGFVGEDEFTYAATDGLEQSPPAIVKLITPDSQPRLKPHPVLTKQATVQLEGYVVDADSVEITGPAGSLTVPVSNGQFSANLPLAPNQRNIFYIIAIDGSQRSAPETTVVTHDAQPPHLNIVTPSFSETVFASTVDIVGTVGDLLSGDTQLEVTVNGQQAQVSAGQGVDRHFFVPNLALTPDTLNQFEVIASDALGNTARQSVTVRQMPQSSAPMLSVISGDRQTATVGSDLVEPIRLQLQKSDGTPFVGKTLRVEVLRGSGLLKATPEADSSKLLLLKTDALGEVSLHWQLGMEAGEWAHELSVSSAGVPVIQHVFASASATTTAGIEILSGQSQRVETGASIVAPLEVRVHDGFNGKADIPVTFRVVEGDGKFFGGIQEQTVSTDASGLARVNHFRLGSIAGNHLIEATFAGNSVAPAVFQLFGIQRVPTGTTEFSGFVLDQHHRPIENAFCQLIVNGSPAGYVQSDAQGYFMFSDVADGSAKLTISAPDVYSIVGQEHAADSFSPFVMDTVIVPGASNRLNDAIRVAPAWPEGWVAYDNSDELTLTLAEFPGLSLTVAAGSMRLADGTKPTPANPSALRLSAVPVGQMDVSLPSGASSQLMLRLEPSGATFDPPIQVMAPNTAGLPETMGSRLLALSADRQGYEVVATGNVKDQGSLLMTSPNQGLSYATWATFYASPETTATVTRSTCEESRAQTQVSFCDPQGLFDLDERWSFYLDGKSVQVNADGTFQLPNVPVQDRVNGVGDAATPDQMSDHFVRLIGFRHEPNHLGWLYSTPFQMTPGGVFNVDQITFSDQPPPSVESLSLVGTSELKVGETKPLQLMGTMPDRSQRDVTNQSEGTFYISSNPEIVSVDQAGRMTGHQEGKAHIWVGHKGFAKVKEVTVAPNESVRRTYEGFVFYQGNPVENAVVSGGSYQPHQTDANGYFSYQVSPIYGTPDKVWVNVELEGDDYRGIAIETKQIAPFHVDFGIIELNRGKDEDGDGLSAIHETALSYFGYPFSDRNSDSDGDGIKDGDEDPDFDELSNLWEATYTYIPYVRDSDSNGVRDGDEDPDGDFLINKEEAAAGTHPFVADTDGDGMSDAYEYRFGLNPLDFGDVYSDFDQDGLSNLEESRRGTDPFSADQTLPNLESVFPENGAEDVFLNQKLVMRFNQALQARSVTSENISITSTQGVIEGTFSLSVDLHTVTFQPSHNWPAGSEIEVALVGVRSAAAVELEQRLVTTFQTAFLEDTTQPRLESFYPTYNQELVPVNAAIQMVFTEPMDLASLSSNALTLKQLANFQDIPFEVVVAPDFLSVEMRPHRVLEPGTEYRIFFQPDAFVDIAGNALAGVSSYGRTLYFTTATTTSPTFRLRNIYPETDHDDVPTNFVALLEFDKSVSIASLESHFSLLEGARKIAGQFERVDFGNYVAFTPDPGSIAPNTTYQMVLGVDVVDVTGQRLSNPQSVTFQTGEGAYEEALAVEHRYPSLVGVAPGNTKVVYRFNQPLVPFTVKSEHIYIEYAQDHLDGDVLLSEDGRTMTFTPHENLSAIQSSLDFTLSRVRTQTNKTISIEDRFRSSGEVDSVPPELLAANPQNGSNGVPLNARIELTFSEPIVAQAYSESQLLLLDSQSNPVPVEIQENRQQISLIPTALQANANYSIQLSRLYDLAGHALPSQTISFNTSDEIDTTPPELVNTSPTDGSVNVEPNDPVVITFNEEIDPTSVTEQGFRVTQAGVQGYVAGEITAAGTEVIFTPTPNMSRAPQSQSLVTVSVNNIRDRAGNSMASTSFSYTTGGAEDNTSPRVHLISPDPDAFEIRRGQEIALFFTEPMDPATLTKQNIRVLMGPSLSNNLTIEVAADLRSMVLTDYWSSFYGNEVILSSAIQDLSGNPLEPFELSFHAVSTHVTDSFITRSQPASNDRPLPHLPIILYGSNPFDFDSLAEGFTVVENGTLKTGQMELLAEGRMLVFTPHSAFGFNSEITAEMASTVLDTEGNRFRNYSLTFMTAPDPQQGFARIVDRNFYDLLPANPVLRVRFDKPLDPTTVNQANISLTESENAIPFSFGLEVNNTQLRITPLEDLQEDIYYRVRASDLLALNGSIAEGVSYSVNRDASADEISPRLLASYPAVTSDFALNGAIELEFDERISRLSIHPESLTVQIDGVFSRDWSVSYLEDKRVVRLQFHRYLPSNVLLQIHGEGLSDEAGNLVEPFTLNYTTGGALDITSPMLVGSSPRIDEANVPINGKLTLVYNEPIDPRSVPTVSLVDRQTNVEVALTGGLQNDGRTLEFYPDSLLSVNRSYRLTVEGLTDLVGLGSSQDHIDFTTGFENDTTPPAVVSISPDGQDNVPRNPVILVEMDELVSDLNLSEAIRLESSGMVPLNVERDGALIRITPQRFLAPHTTYTLTVEGLVNVSNLTMDGANHASFTTGLDIDFQSPYVLQKSPVEQAPLNARILVQFSEPIQPLNLAQSLSLRVGSFSNGVDVAFDFELLDGGQLLQVTPSETMLPNSEYVLRWSSLQDFAGNSTSYLLHFTTTAGSDATPPVVILTSPQANASDVPVNARVRVGFYDEILFAGLPDTALTLMTGDTPIETTLTAQADGKVLTLTPHQALQPSTTYQVVADQLPNLAGHELSGQLLTFHTGGLADDDLEAPSLVSRSPENNATNISRDTPIVLTFSEAIDPLSISRVSFDVSIREDRNSVPISGNVTVNDRVLTFVPQVDPTRTPQANARIQVRVEGIQDYAGNPSARYFTYYNTDDEVDETRPTVISVFPEPGAVDVSPSTQITLTFSETLEYATIRSTSFAVFVDDKVYQQNPVVSFDRLSVTLPVSLPGKSSIMVVATEDLKDLSGNPLIPFSSTFTTGETPTLGPAEVAQVWPRTGQTQVALDEPILLYFDKPLASPPDSTGIHLSANGALVPFTLELSHANHALSILPLAPLPSGARCELYVNDQLMGANSLSVTPYESWFRTVSIFGDPEVLSTTGLRTDVPLNFVAELRFNRALDPATLDDATFTLTNNDDQQLLALDFSLAEDNHLVRITPAETPAANAFFTFRSTGTLTDFEGNAVPVFTSWLRTTESQDQFPPQISLITPPDGFTGALNNPKVEVWFDEPINAHSLNLSNVHLADSQGPIVLNLELSQDLRQLALDPALPLENNTTYTLSLEDVRDLAGNLLMPVTSQFTTGSETDDQRPQVLRSSPADGTENVPVNAVVSLRFSEPMNIKPGSSPVSIYNLSSSQSVPFTWQIDPQLQFMQLIPDASLAVGNQFRIGFSSTLSDFAGNRIESAAIEFETTIYSDQTAPTVVLHHPADGQADVPLNGVISIRFSEPIVAENATISLSDGSPIPTRITQLDGNRVLRITPMVILDADTSHDLVVDNITDLAGNALSDPLSFSFTTSQSVDLSVPNSVYIEPDRNDSLVPSNTRIAVLFDDPIDPTSIHQDTFYVESSSGSPVQASYSVSPDNLSAIMVPAQPLEMGTTYYVYLRGVHDQAGNSLANDSSSFKVANLSYDSDPGVPQTSIPPGTTGVPVNAHMFVAFPRSFLRTSVLADAITLEQGEEGVPFDIVYPDGFGSVEVVPKVPLQPNSSYRIQVSGIEDLAGYTFVGIDTTFTTASMSEPDTQRPQVVSVTPADQAHSVGIHTPITVTFDETLDATTVSQDTLRVTLNGSNDRYPGDLLFLGDSLTFTPAAPWPRLSQINVLLLNNVDDLAGNRVLPFESQFTTANERDQDAPTVLSVNPADGSHQISPQQNIIVQFSEPVDHDSFTENSLVLLANGEIIDRSLSFSGDSRTLTLLADLPELATINLFLTTGITDFNGNALVPFESSFSTGIATDSSKPQVISQNPDNGASGIPVNRDIYLFFSKPITSAGLAQGSFVSQNGLLHPGNMALEAEGYVLRFTPAQDFAYDSLIQIGLTTEITDTSGNSVLPYLGEFRTEVNPRQTPTEIVRFSANNGLVPRNAVLELAFSGPLNPKQLADGIQILDSEDQPVAIDVSLIGDGSIIRVTPQALLPADSRMRFQVLDGVIFDALGNAIGSYGRYFDTEDEVDDTPPAHIFHSPFAAATDIPLNTRIRLFFNENLNRINLARGAVRIQDGGQSIPYSYSFESIDGQDVFSIKPYGPLQASTTYTVAVEDVADHANNLSLPYSFTFTTATVLNYDHAQVLQTVPTDEETDFPVNGVIRVSFSEPMDLISMFANVELSGPDYQDVDFYLTLSSNQKQLLITPDEPLQAISNYRLHIGYRIQDLAGNLLPRNYDIEFSTSLQTDTQPPEVLAVSPLDGWEDVPRNVRLSLLLDEAPNPDSLDNIVLSSANGVIGTAISVEGSLVVIRPLETLPANTHHECTFSGIQDLSGHSMVGSQSFAFTTSDRLDLSRTYVTARMPSSFEGAAPSNSLIMLRFNQPPAPTSIKDNIKLIIVDTQVVVPSVIQFTENNKVLTVTPAIQLQEGIRYRLDVASGLNGLNHLGGTGDGLSFELGFEPDLTPPQIVGTTPAHLATDIPVNTQIALAFDEPVYFMESAVLTLHDSNQQEVQFQMSSANWFGRGLSGLYIQPDQNLQPGQTYQLSLSGAINAVGMTAEDLQIQFTTRSSSEPDTQWPSVISISPADNATGVAVDQPVVVTFDEPVDILSINASTFELKNRTTGLNLAGSYQVDGNQVTFLPDWAALRQQTLDSTEAMRIEVRIHEVRDLAGNWNNFFFSQFTIGPYEDSSRPQVIATTPSQGAVGIHPGTDVTVQFNESLDPASIPGGLTLFRDGVKAGLNHELNTDGRTLVIRSGFASNAYYELVLGAGIRDVAGNSLEPHVLSFQTGDSGALDRPKVVFHLPESLTEVADPSEIEFTLYFDKPLDLATLDQEDFLLLEDYNLVESEVKLSNNGHLVRLKPLNVPTYGAQLDVYVSDFVSGLNGLPVEPWSSSFTVPGDLSLATPRVIRRSIPINAGSPTNVVVNLQFSEPMDPASYAGVSLTTQDGPAIEVESTFQNNNQTLLLRPVSELEPQSRYSLSVEPGLTDLQGDPLSNYGFSIYANERDDQAPQVLQTSPSDYLQDVPLNSLLQFQVDKDIDLIALQYGITLQNQQNEEFGFSIAYGTSKNILTLRPHALLDPLSTYTVRLADLRSQAGIPSAEVSWTFTTGAHVQITEPAAAMFIPDQAAMIPASTRFALRFAEPVNRISASEKIYLEDVDTQAQIPATFSFESNDQVVVLVPDSPLDIGTEVEFGLDSFLNNLVSDAFPRDSRQYLIDANADATPPQLVSAFPDGGMDYPMNVHLDLLFDEPVDLTKTEGIRLLGPKGIEIPLSFEGVSLDTRLHITPQRLLEPQTSYTIEIMGFHDISGNVNNDFVVIDFTTGEDLDNSLPGIFASDPSGNNVPLNATVLVSTYHPIIPNSVSAMSFVLREKNTGRRRSGEIVISADLKTFEFIPDEILDPNTTYELRLENWMSWNGQSRNIGNFLNDFTTGTVQDVEAPRVTLITPSNNATNVEADVNITMTVTEPLALAYLHAEGFSLVGPEGPVTGSLTYSSGEASVRFNPHNDLEPGATYQITIHPRDFAGNQGESVTSSFTVAP